MKQKEKISGLTIFFASTHIGCGFGVLDESECLQISITNSKPNGASSVSILNTTTQWGEGEEREGGGGIRTEYYGQGFI